MIRKLRSWRIPTVLAQSQIQKPEAAQPWTFSSRAAAEKHERAVQYFKSVIESCDLSSLGRSAKPKAGAKNSWPGAPLCPAPVLFPRQQHPDVTEGILQSGGVGRHRHHRRRLNLRATGLDGTAQERRIVIHEDVKGQRWCVPSNLARCRAHWSGRRSSRSSHRLRSPRAESAVWLRNGETTPGHRAHAHRRRFS